MQYTVAKQTRLKWYSNLKLQNKTLIPEHVYNVYNSWIGPAHILRSVNSEYNHCWTSVENMCKSIEVIALVGPACTK